MKPTGGSGWKCPFFHIIKQQTSKQANIRLQGLLAGDLGDRCLTAALATLAERTHLLARLCPGQTGSLAETGICRFRLWHFGDWLEVSVDDRLPCFQHRLLTISQGDQLFPSLLEKAFAKFASFVWLFSEKLRGGG